MQICSECVEEFLKCFLDNSKEALEKDEFFPIALPLEFSEDDFEIKDPILIGFKCESEKIANFLDIGASCWFEEVKDVVVILNGCGKRVDDFKQFIENYDTERPSLYPESMRDDFLILAFIDLIDEDFKTLMCKYSKDETGKLVFEAPVFVDDGEAVSGIVEFIIQGWNLMYRFLSEENENSNN